MDRARVRVRLGWSMGFLCRRGFVFGVRLDIVRVCVGHNSRDFVFDNRNFSCFQYLGINLLFLSGFLALFRLPGNNDLVPLC